LSKQSAVLGELSKEWKTINRDSLRRSLISLYESELISLHSRRDEFEIVLSSEGKKLAQKFDLDRLKIKKPERWDGLWRIVTFDIPEERKKAREALRFHLEDLGLLNYQKSVFIFPYPCEKELKFITEFFQVHRYVRLIIAKTVDNEKEFIKKFRLH
jgi:phenylacetic acid degradation operon negative regulatory protein